MIYFSELHGKNVVTEDQVKVGTLEDIIFLASENPSITKIVVRGALKERLIIPIAFLRQINHMVVIGKEYIIATLEENELHLVKNLLDKQIIDLKGNKIVRVNDVAIQDKGGLYIAGVDIGVLGIIRALGIGKHVTSFLAGFGIKLTSQFLSWGDIQPLELVHGEVKLRKKEEKLTKILPEDLADYLEKTNIVNAQRFLRILDERKAAEVIGSLNLNFRAALFKQYKSERAAHLLSFIESDEAADILLTIPTKKRIEIIELLPEKKKHELIRLMEYSSTQIGDLLMTDYITVSPDDIAKEVMNKLKKETNDFSFLNNIYVINKNEQLSGVFNLHELLQQNDNTPVYKFMTQNVIVFHLTTPAGIALNRMIKYKLQVIPVIDQERKLIGVVTIIELIEMLYKKLL